MSKEGSKTATGVALLRAAHMVIDGEPKILNDPVVLQLFGTAIIDNLLSDGPCEALARDLTRRGVPFIVHSGQHPRELPFAFGHAPFVTKTAPFRSLVKGLSGLLPPGSLSGTIAPAAR